MKRFKKILLISISVLVPVLLIVLMIASCDPAEYAKRCDATQIRQEFKEKNLPKKSNKELTQLKDEIEAKLNETGREKYKISIFEVDKKYGFVAIGFDKATKELIESFKTKISDSEYVMILECPQIRNDVGK